MQMAQGTSPASTGPANIAAWHSEIQIEQDEMKAWPQAARSAAALANLPVPLADTTDFNAAS